MLENADPNLINDDLRPVPPEGRHWSVLSMAALWIGMVVCVPTYMLAGGLIGQGMSWWQAVLTIMLGNLVVLVPMVLNGHPGTKYGIPFPVLARAAFGIHGAHVPALLRALVACGWFGIQTWIGGQAIFQIIDAIAERDLAAAAPLPLLGITGLQLVCFLLFWALQVAIIWKGVESIRLFETLAAPFLILMGVVLLAWAWVRAGGMGSMLAQPSQFAPGGPREGQFWAVFFPNLTAMVGFWATLSLNIPDFTRYAKSQRDQVLGQALGLPTTMTLFAFIGVAVTSATATIFGEPVWDPVVLVGKIGGWSVPVSLLALSVATLSTNIAANVVSPANALINAAPRAIDFRKGALITAGLGLIMFPWKLLSSVGAYIFTWLIGYSALLGPIGGILVADYYLVRKTELDLEALYRKDGRYAYGGSGFNPAAMIALVLGVLPNVPGFLRAAGAFGDPTKLDPSAWDTVYSYAVFVGAALAAGAYLALMQVFPHDSLAPGGASAPEKPAA